PEDAVGDGALEGAGERLRPRLAAVVTRAGGFVCAHTVEGFLEVLGDALLGSVAEAVGETPSGDVTLAVDLGVLDALGDPVLDLLAELRGDRPDADVGRANDLSCHRSEPPRWAQRRG